MPERKHFRMILREALEKRFGRHRITASELANAFNLITNESISDETARKWLIGSSLPRYERIFELVHWLDIDPRSLFHYDPQNRTLHEQELAEAVQHHLDGQFNLQDIETIIKKIKPL
jgi:transcriptional regulator with XRE-family HTH domain